MENQSVQIKKRHKTEYYGVSTIITEKGKKVYGATLSSALIPAVFKTEKEAALAVDKWLIERGKQPVNILIPTGNRRAI